MQTRDHRLLGCYVLEYCNIKPDTLCRRMFLLGCVEPDWNLITYTRGSIKYQFCHGHNAENAKKHLSRLTEKLMDSGVRTPLQWFRFGTVLHYLADSFTFVHNHCFTGNLKEHRLYEKMLHKVFVKQLYTHNADAGPEGEFTHEHYLSEQRSFQTDCRYIAGASLALCSRLSIFKAQPGLDSMFAGAKLPAFENRRLPGWEKSLEYFDQRETVRNLR